MTKSLAVNPSCIVEASKSASRSRACTRGPQAASGFTLLELVVALSVFALGLTGVASLNNNALLATANAARMQEASYLAERHLAALQLAEDLVTGDYAGTFQGLSQSASYPWRLRVSQLDNTPLEPQLRAFPETVNPLELYLVVTVAEGSRPLEFHALLLMPIVQSMNAMNAQAFDAKGKPYVVPSKGIRLGDRIDSARPRVGT